MNLAQALLRLIIWQGSSALFYVATLHLHIRIAHILVLHPASVCGTAKTVSVATAYCCDMQFSEAQGVKLEGPDGMLDMDARPAPKGRAPALLVNDDELSHGPQVSSLLSAGLTVPCAFVLETSWAF